MIAHYANASFGAGGGAESDVGAGAAGAAVGAAAGAVAAAAVDFGAVGGVGTSMVELQRVCVVIVLLALRSPPGTCQFKHMATFSWPAPCVFCLLLCTLPARAVLLMAFSTVLLGLSLP